LQREMVEAVRIAEEKRLQHEMIEAARTADDECLAREAEEAAKKVEEQRLQHERVEAVRIAKEECVQRELMEAKQKAEDEHLACEAEEAAKKAEEERLAQEAAGIAEEERVQRELIEAKRKAEEEHEVVQNKMEERLEREMAEAACTVEQRLQREMIKAKCRAQEEHLVREAAQKDKEERLRCEMAKTGSKAEEKERVQREMIEADRMAEEAAKKPDDACLALEAMPKAEQDRLQRKLIQAECEALEENLVCEVEQICSRGQACSAQEASRKTAKVDKQHESIAADRSPHQDCSAREAGQETENIQEERSVQEAAPRFEKERLQQEMAEEAHDADQGLLQHEMIGPECIAEEERVARRAEERANNAEEERFAQEAAHKTEEECLQQEMADAVRIAEEQCVQRELIEAKWKAEEEHLAHETGAAAKEAEEERLAWEAAQKTEEEHLQREMAEAACEASEELVQRELVGAKRKAEDEHLASEAEDAARKAKAECLALEAVQKSQEERLQREMAEAVQKAQQERVQRELIEVKRMAEEEHVAREAEEKARIAAEDLPTPEAAQKTREKRWQHGITEASSIGEAGLEPADARVPLLNEQDASDLQKIPVKELKAACQELDLPCDGRKKDLITRLIMFAESQGISASQLQLSQTQENDHEPARVEPSAHPIEVAVKTALPGTAQPAEVENPTIEESCMGAAMAVVPPAKTRAAGVLGQDLSSLSARDLRNACAEHGLPTGGSKKALLERLTPMLSPGAEAEAPSRKAFTQEVAVTAPPVGPQTAGSLVQDLTSLSTRELRIACTEHGLLTGGSKMVLVERLTAMVMAPIDERPPSLVNRSSSVPASQPDASAQSPSRLPSLWVPPTRSPLREETRADTQDIVSTPSAQAGLQLQACRYSPESEQVALGAKSAQDIVTTVARELSLLPRHELREACLRVGIPAQGSKAELVDRLAALAATDAPLGEEEVLQAPRPTDSPEAPPINTDGFEESQDIPASLQGLSLEALQAACRACGLSTSGDEAALTTRLALLMSQPETAEMVKPLDPDPSIVQSVDQRLGYGFDEPLSHGPYHTDVSAAQPAAESCTSSSLMACAGMQQMKGCLSLARNSELSGSSGLQGDVAQQSCCDSADPRSGICIDAARSAPKPNARGAKPPTSASGGLIAAPAETSCVAESIPIEALPPPAIESDSHWAAVASREGASLESSIPLGQPDPSAEQALVGKQLGVELAQGIRGGGSKVTAASGGVFTGELGRRKDVTPPLHQAAPAARNTLGNAVISAPVPVATADSASATGLLMLRSIELRRLCRERGLEATGSKEDLAVRILTLAQTGDATPSEQEACTPTPERQRAPAAPAKLPQRQEVSGTPQARVDVALASLPPEVLQRHASEATTQPIVLQSAAAAGVVVAAVAEHIPAVAAQKRPGHHLWLAPESPVQTRTESTDKTPSQPLAPTNLWVEPLHEHAMAVGDEVSLLKRPRTSLVAGPQGDIAPEPSAVPKLSTLWQTMSTFKITKSAFAGGVQSHALGDAEPGAACRDAMGNARGRANPSSKTRSVLPPPGWLLGALPTQAEAHLTNVSGQVCGLMLHVVMDPRVLHEWSYPSLMFRLREHLQREPVTDRLVQVHRAAVWVVCAPGEHATRIVANTPRSGPALRPWGLSSCRSCQSIGRQQLLSGFQQLLVALKHHPQPRAESARHSLRSEPSQWHTAMDHTRSACESHR